MSRLTLGDEARSLYDGAYEGPSEWRRLCAVDKAANVVSLCAGLPHATVLEIGAGDGSVLARLAELGFGKALHALEVSEKALEAIRQQRIPGLIECRLFDGYALPHEAAAFDLVILSHVLEHVEYPRRLLYEASRVGRYVFVEVPLEDTLRLGRDYVPDTVGHINVYSPLTIRWLIQTCGLAVSRQIVTNPSRATARYLGGSHGVARWLVKSAALRLWPGAATRLFTFHSALLCTRAEDKRGEAPRTKPCGS